MLSLAVNMQKLGNFQKIQNFIRESNADVLVGFLSGKMHVPTPHKAKKGGGGEDAGADWRSVENAELAKRLSFGDGAIPPRPFIEDGLRSKKDGIKKAVGEQLSAALSGRANWDKVGTMAVGAVQELVRGDYYKENEPNSERTVERKGSDTPLIDGGDLINSLEYVVEV